MDNTTVGILVTLSGILGAAGVKLLDWITTRREAARKYSKEDEKDTVEAYKDLHARQEARITTLEGKIDRCEKDKNEYAIKYTEAMGRIVVLEEKIKETLTIAKAHGKITEAQQKETEKVVEQVKTKVQEVAKTAEQMTKVAQEVKDKIDSSQLPPTAPPTT